MMPQVWQLTTRGRATAATLPRHWRALGPVADALRRRGDVRIRRRAAAVESREGLAPSGATRKFRKATPAPLLSLLLCHLSR